MAGPAGPFSAEVDSTFVWSQIAVVKFGRYVPKCARQFEAEVQ